MAALASHYGSDSRVWGWQIDNEPSHYGTSDYGSAVTENFRTWLKNKYKTIENLNNAWGTTFWSGVYSEFDQINLPAASQVSGPASYISLVDFRRFSADECASFVSMQYRILRGKIQKNQFITSNFMGRDEKANA